jgi:hypothetical protein
VDIDNIPKVGIANRSSLHVGCVHGLAMLVIHGLANVERLSIERIAPKMLKRTLRELAGSGASTKGSTI